MNRRILLQSGAAMVAWPGVLLAQTKKRFRVGFLATSDETTAKPFVEVFAGIAIPSSILLRANRLIE